jgi:hypothetical protein
MSVAIAKPERVLLLNIRGFLQAKNWRTYRHSVGLVSGGGGTFSTAEKGTPDLEAHYYFAAGVALVLWIETKRARKAPKPHQSAWQERERKLGATVWTVDDFADFVSLYEHDFAWLHTGSLACGQTEMLFGRLPEEIRPQL